MKQKAACILSRSAAGRRFSAPAALPYGGKGILCFALVLLLGILAACPCTAAAERITICVLDSGSNLEDAEGWNCLDDTADITDNAGHGTKVCELLASCAPDVNIVMLKCFETEESFDGQSAVRAVYAAADRYDADFILMGWTASRESGELHEAVRYASEKGIILVAPAGNLSLSTGLGAKVYPASWDEVIGVGGVDLDANGEPSSSLWYLSGKAVYVCANAAYENERGTSFAAPRVAAAILSHMAGSPGETDDSIRQMLRDTARDLGEPGYDPVYGWGYIGSK